MFNHSKHIIYWLTFFLVLVAACNTVETKKLNSGTWDDFPNWDFPPPPPPNPYISDWEVEPFPRFPGDSLTITCNLYDSLNASDYYFNFTHHQYNSLPVGTANGNVYRTTAPDSAGTFYIGVYLHSDSTLSDTLDYDSIGMTIENPY